MAVLRRALPDEEGSAAACYECLYEENREARFRGVGVDVGPAGRGRVKFYVRVSRQDAAELLGAAARLLARIDPAFDGDDLLRRARDLHSALKGSAAERAEIATAFESDGAPSLKIVFFLLPGGKFEERLGIGNAALERLGADPGPLRDVCRSVVGGLGTGDRASPIHALGLESGGRTSNRVNVYVQPVPTP
jgi:hypothetical protein